MVKKTFKTAFMKNFKPFFKNLTTKNDWTSIKTKLKSLMLHKKTIFSNYNQNANKKNWRKSEKN